MVAKATIQQFCYCMKYTDKIIEFYFITPIEKENKSFRIKRQYDSFCRISILTKIMENNYYLIIDNITEITSIDIHFKSVLSMSLSAKYLYFNVNNMYSINLAEKNTFNLLNRFDNIKKLLYLEYIDPDFAISWSKLTKLKDLKIEYIRFDIISDIDFKKLNQLISLDIQHKLPHCWIPKKRKEIIFLIENNSVQRLTFRYDHHKKYIILINCPKLTYLNLDSCKFDIKHNDMISNLQDLSLTNVYMNHEYHRLTFLRIETFNSDLHLTHLFNLISLYIGELNHDLIIANLSSLAGVGLFCCRGNVKLYNLNQLKYLSMFRMKDIEISLVDNLTSVSLTQCNMDKIKYFEMVNVKNLYIDGFQYSDKVKERLAQFRKEKIAVDGKYPLRKLFELIHLTHLILIDNTNIKNLGELKNLKKLTIASCTKRKINIRKHVVRKYMGVEEARSKYAKYRMRAE